MVPRSTIASVNAVPCAPRAREKCAVDAFTNKERASKGLSVAVTQAEFPRARKVGGETKVNTGKGRIHCRVNYTISSGSLSSRKALMWRWGDDREQSRNESHGIIKTPTYGETHYTTLHYTTLHYTTLHYTTLHYTTLHYTTLHYTTLHYILDSRFRIVFLFVPSPLFHGLGFLICPGTYLMPCRGGGGRWVENGTGRAMVTP